MTSSPSTRFEQNPQAQKSHQLEVRAMFDLVAPRYDLMNDVMSMGIHRLWKRRCIRLLAPRNNELVVDLAGGTGDLAAAISKCGAQTIVCDPCVSMMTETRQKSARIKWLAGFGESIPLADNSIDALTIAFGLRNMSDPKQGLNEIYRILKPGGRFLCLEFSHAASWLKPIYDAYSNYIIPHLGALIAGEKTAYKYLIESIREFPDQLALARLLEEAGFKQVHYQNLAFGIAAIHMGHK